MKFKKMDKDHSTALIKAIRYSGSQQALARAIGASKQQVNYWLNQANEIPYDYVLRIEWVTQGNITHYELAPNHSTLNNRISVNW